MLCSPINADLCLCESKGSGRPATTQIVARERPIQTDVRTLHDSRYLEAPKRECFQCSVVILNIRTKGVMCQCHVTSRAYQSMLIGK